MPTRFNASAYKSQIKQQVNKAKRAISDYNRAVDSYNNKVKQAVNKYNQAVRQHNSNVLLNRSKIKTELRRLSASSSRNTTSYKTSVLTVNHSYENAVYGYDYLDNHTPFQEYVYSGIEQENANNLETANVVINNLQPETQAYSLKDTKIMDRLSLISSDLDKRWKGALYALNPANVEATRHFCTSTREIFTEIFENKAKDTDVFSIFPNCDKTNNGKATRKSKIRYFLHNKGIEDENIEDFIEKDMQNILELYNVLNSGTHGEAGKYSFEKLAVIKKRVEDGLIFLCDIAS